MNPIKIGGRVSVDAVVCEHVRAVVNDTPTLDEAARVLKKNNRWLLRYRESHHLGKPQRQPLAPEEDGETWLDD